jgi:hypothetical protein
MVVRRARPDVRLVIENYAVANVVGTINAGVNVAAPTTLDITPLTQAGSPWVDSQNYRRTGKGKTKSQLALPRASLVQIKQA